MLRPWGGRARYPVACLLSTGYVTKSPILASYACALRMKPRAPLSLDNHEPVAILVLELGLGAPWLLAGRLREFDPARP